MPLSRIDLPEPVGGSAAGQQEGGEPVAAFPLGHDHRHSHTSNPLNEKGKGAFGKSRDLPPQGMGSEGGGGHAPAKDEPKHSSQIVKIAQGMRTVLIRSVT